MIPNTNNWQLKKTKKTFTDGVFPFEGYEYTIYNDTDVICVMRCTKDEEEKYDKYADLILKKGDIMDLTKEEIDFLWSLVEHAQQRDDNSEKEHILCHRLIVKFKRQLEE